MGASVRQGCCARPHRQALAPKLHAPAALPTTLGALPPVCLKPPLCPTWVQGRGLHLAANHGLPRRLPLRPLGTPAAAVPHRTPKGGREWGVRSAARPAGQAFSPSEKRGPCRSGCGLASAMAAAAAAEPPLVFPAPITHPTAPPPASPTPHPRPTPPPGALQRGPPPLDALLPPRHPQFRGASGGSSHQQQHHRWARMLGGSVSGRVG